MNNSKYILIILTILCKYYSPDFDNCAMSIRENKFVCRKYTFIGVNGIMSTTYSQMV